MRLSIVAAGLALSLLAACGQPAEQAETPTAEQAPAALRTYAPADFTTVNGGTVTVTGEGVQVVTDPRTGAMSAALRLGDEAKQEGTMLRVRSRVSEGVISLVMTHANWAPGYRPYYENVPAGEEVTVNLPIDRDGEPMFIVSNAGPGGTPSTAVILSVELVQGTPS